MAAADRIIFRLGRRQHGVVASWQLMEMGVSQREIQRRVADRRLRIIHRGVYAMGPLTRGGAWLAAVLACGRGAVLSHRDAAALHNLRPCNRSSVEVTVTRRLRKRRRIDAHRTRSLPDRDQTIVDGIPVTSVARTLLDLAEVVPTDHLRRAYEAAERHGLLDMHAVHELVARSNGRRGLSALLALLDYDPREAVESKSDLESRFLDLVREAGLPLPQLNVLVEGFPVDAYWPGARLVVELQSWEHHGHRQAFERDNSKLSRLQVAGFTALPVTDRQLRYERDWLIASLRAAVAERALGGTAVAAATL